MAKVRTKEAAREWREAETGFIAKLKAAVSMTHWLELETGAAVAAGMRVRYFRKTYVCIKAHEKSLLHTPLDTAYWQEESAQ